MTEKRLIVREGDYAWIDTTTGYVVEVEDAFDLINQLHEENKRLKSDLTNTKILLDSMGDKYSRLLKLIHGFNGDDVND